MYLMIILGVILGFVAATLVITFHFWGIIIAIAIIIWTIGCAKIFWDLIGLLKTINKKQK
jgi:hypothetical protein